jgi:hypothetical protein
VNKIFTMSIDIENNPDAVGEFLRNEFFDQSKGERGCYSTFEIRPDVIKLKDEPVEDCGDEFTYQVYKKIVQERNVLMKYYWDGDGTLEFHFTDRSMLINTDCKKDYTWDYIEKAVA